ncbi:MAG TPA: hypothetical protein VFP78_10785 [Solirubrobacteraceae bacterium]|nr:hypothetical protein [Solirubrobacteraceae bacterium]
MERAEASGVPVGAVRFAGARFVAAVPVFAAAVGFAAAVFLFDAVADLGPPGFPGFAAPTVEGEPVVVRERVAVDGVVFAAGVPGVEGGASVGR